MIVLANLNTVKPPVRLTTKRPLLQVAKHFPVKSLHSANLLKTATLRKRPLLGIKFEIFCCL